MQKTNEHLNNNDSLVNNYSSVFFLHRAYNPELLQQDAMQHQSSY